MIPRIFHRIWLGDAPMPHEYNTYWARLMRLHPKWRFQTWHQPPVIINADLYDEVDSMASKADILRLELLYQLGGVYLDCDVEPLRSFDPLLEVGAFAGWEDNGKHLCNAVLGAEPCHPAIADLLDALPAWAKAHRNEPPNQRTGPALLTATWKDRADVTLHPKDAFYPYRWDESDPGTYPETSYAVHRWGHAW